MDADPVRIALLFCCRLFRRDRGRQYDEAALEAERPHVLVVVSAAKSIDTAFGRTVPAGVYLAEATIPVQKMVAAGAHVTVVSPRGVAPTLDEVSDKAKWFENKEEYAAAKELFDGTLFQHPGRLEDISDAVLDRYDAVFLPGGHAPMNDLSANPDLARILRRQHAANKVTGAICHGTSGLLAARTSGQPWIYAGYRLTGYSDIEEILGVTLGYVGGFPKLKLQNELQRGGARYSQSFIPFTSHVVHDRELVTGQDPQSTKEFAEELTKALLEQYGRRR